MKAKWIILAAAATLLGGCTDNTGTGGDASDSLGYGSATSNSDGGAFENSNTYTLDATNTHRATNFSNPPVSTNVNGRRVSGG